MKFNKYPHDEQLCKLSMESSKWIPKMFIEKRQQNTRKFDRKKDYKIKLYLKTKPSMESSKFYGNLIEKRTTKFTLHDKCHGNLIERKEWKQLRLSATAHGLPFLPVFSITHNIRKFTRVEMCCACLGLFDIKRDSILNCVIWESKKRVNTYRHI